MENLLSIRTEATFSLNFLVYIQNIFLNQNQREGDFKFPLLSSKDIAFHEEFHSRYKELWFKVAKGVFEHPMNDIKIFHGEKDLFYHRLFVEGEDSLGEYREIYQSFKIWWNSFSGRFSIERSIDEKNQKLYQDLAESLTEMGNAPEKELNISLIFDDCLLADVEDFPYFSVVTAKEYFVAYKELLAKLKEGIF